MPRRFTATSAGAGAAGSRGASRSGFSWSRVTPQGFQDGLPPRARIWAFWGAFVQVVIPQQVEDGMDGQIGQLPLDAVAELLPPGPWPGSGQ